MKFISDKEHGEGRKVSFSDQDEWGRTSNGIIFTTDNRYLVTGLELYTSRYGVVRCNQEGKVTYCQAWEKDHVKQGIGVSSHFATKLISAENESHELYEKVYSHVYQSLKIHYLRQIIHNILKDKKKVALDPSLFKVITNQNPKIQENPEQKYSSKLLGRFLGR